MKLLCPNGCFDNTKYFDPDDLFFHITVPAHVSITIDITGKMISAMEPDIVSFEEKKWLDNPVCYECGETAIILDGSKQSERA